jgi:integrase
LKLVASTIILKVDRWKTIRAVAGYPDFEFYELKHRAITHMVTSIPSGGLGLTPPEVSAIVGHQDAGVTIARHYLKLDEKRLIERALEAYATAQSPRGLRVVGES